MPSASKIAYTANRGALARILVAPSRGRAENDNGAGKSTDPAIVEAALRLFGEHGLGAARAARHRAEQAFFANHQEQYRWWLEICRQLDRRMALDMQRQADSLTNG